MSVVSLLEAKTHFSRLVEEVECGATHEIVIARNGKPAARLVPIGPAVDAGKRLGLLEGRYPSSSQAEFDVANKTIARHQQQKQFRRSYIRQWREYRGLTLEQLAERLGEMVPSNLSMLERGLRGYTQPTLERIAVALQTDVASLLTRTPAESEGMWAIWDQAKPAQRRQIVEIAKTITRTDN